VNLVTVTQAIGILGGAVGRHTLRGLVRSGAVKGTVIGKKYLIDADDLKAYLRRQTAHVMGGGRVREGNREAAPEAPPEVSR
jgi:excisionase family DNA binding protein